MNFMDKIRDMIYFNFFRQISNKKYILYILLIFYIYAHKESKGREEPKFVLVLLGSVHVVTDHR